MHKAYAKHLPCSSANVAYGTDSKKARIWESTSDSISRPRRPSHDHQWLIDLVISATNDELEEPEFWSQGMAISKEWKEL